MGARWKKKNSVGHFHLSSQHPTVFNCRRSRPVEIYNWRFLGRHISSVFNNLLNDKSALAVAGITYGIGFHFHDSAGHGHCAKKNASFINDVDPCEDEKLNEEEKKNPPIQFILNCDAARNHPIIFYYLQRTAINLLDALFFGRIKVAAFPYVLIWNRVIERYRVGGEFGDGCVAHFTHC